MTKLSVNINKIAQICIYRHKHIDILRGRQKRDTKSNIFFDFGPYLAYGLFGNYNIDYAELENDKNDLFTCGAYKRFDFGCQGNIGINIANFQIGIGAVQSIIKPTKDIWNLENPKEKSFLLNISYFFNR